MDIECSNNQKCFAVTNCDDSTAIAKYCGPTQLEADRCNTGASCNRNTDCPFGSTCFPVESCNADVSNQFCGFSLYSASRCLEGSECISDDDCPGSQLCRKVLQCLSAPTPAPQPYGNKYCGRSPSIAATCEVGSECIANSDCPLGQLCYEVECKEATPIPSASPTKDRRAKYCGQTELEAAECSDGTGCRDNDDCPAGSTCFPVDLCSQPGDKYCGISAFVASSCDDGSECVSTVDCPSGQRCYDVVCKGDGSYFCGYSLYSASKCVAGNECTSDQDCRDSQTCREVIECFSPPTESPTNMPTPKPRLTLNVDYLLCLEHGLLTSTSKLTQRTEEEIVKILNNKFTDDLIDVDEKWGVDETHLRVEDVSSKYLLDAPGNFECELLSNVCH